MSAFQFQPQPSHEKLITSLLEQLSRVYASRSVAPEQWNEENRFDRTHNDYQYQFIDERSRRQVTAILQEQRRALRYDATRFL